MILYVCYHETAFNACDINREVCLITDDENRAINWVNEFKQTIKSDAILEWRSYAEHIMNEDLWLENSTGGSVKDVESKMTRHK